jgi:hypothetical protein
MKHKMKKYAAGGAMSDEERYGKVGAEIRRLDPEAYKNRPRSAEGNLKLLKELRERAKTKSTVDFAKEGKAPTVDFAMEGRVRPKTGAIAAGVEPDDTPSQVMRDEARYKVRNQKAPGRPGGNRDKLTEQGYKRGGSVKSSASRRADGIAKKGKTRGRFI